MLAELSQGRSCGQTARGGRASVCRVEFSYPGAAAVTTSLGVQSSANSQSYYQQRARPAYFATANAANSWAMSWANYSSFLQFY